MLSGEVLVRPLLWVGTVFVVPVLARLEGPVQADEVHHRDAEKKGAPGRGAYVVHAPHKDAEERYGQAHEYQALHDGAVTLRKKQGNEIDGRADQHDEEGKIPEFRTRCPALQAGILQKAGSHGIFQGHTAPRMLWKIKRTEERGTQACSFL